MKRPNILFILSDQHRHFDMGWAGNAEVQTPVLDALASECARFSHAYSNCPVCVPARGSLYTGQHALRHGAAGNDIPIRRDQTGIAQVLSAAGYDTALIGKWHLGGVPRDQFIDKDRRLGFQYWRGNNCNHDYMKYYYDDNDDARHYPGQYEPVAQTALALEYLEGRKQSDDPWAMWMCYSTPHPPHLRMPEDELARVRERAESITLRGNVTEFTDDDFVPPPGHHAHPMRPEMRRWQPRYDSMDELKLNTAGYYAHIEAMDAQIGRMLDYLKESGQYDDTIIIYTSDHGDMLGSHGMCDKQIFYQESARIPFLARWRGHIPAGARDQLIGMVDLAPTLLGLLGLSFSADTDGADLSACLTNPSAPGQPYLYTYNIVPAHNAWMRRHSVWHAVTDGRYSYAAGEDGTPIALFDLENDPLELQNLLDALPDVRQRLSGALRGMVEAHAGFLPWQTLLYRSGLHDLWDESQRHFGFPLIEERHKIDA